MAMTGRTETPTLECGAEDRASMRAIYARHGVVVVRGAFELPLAQDMRDTVLALLHARLRSVGAPATENDLDRAYAALKAVDVKLSQQIVVAARETMAFYRAIASPRMASLLAELLPSSSLHVVHDCCMMRIDGKDDGRQFEWHYDFAYNAMSANAVTCWIPITAVAHEMGNMRVVPGTQTEPRLVRMVRDLVNEDFAGPRKIELADRDFDALERNAVTLPEVAPGDVVFLHAQTLHRSGHNSTDRARWIVNPRYSDLMDAEVVARGWKVSRAKNAFVFAEIRPQHVIDGREGCSNDPAAAQ